MPRTLGFFARALFGVNGLLTVWCLGCCGFEPLLNAADRVVTVDCVESMNDSTVPGETSLVATSSVDGCGCVCQSCCAVSAVRLTLSGSSSELLALPESIAVSLVSMALEPRYPPPKAARV